MPSDVTLVIYDSKIIAMSLPGGPVWRWARQRSKRVERLAKLNVGKRSGRTERSIEASYNAGASRPHDVVMEVSAGTEYALFHHEGTTGPITPVGSRFMVLPAWGPWPTLRATSVRGQRANPFLFDALREVMRDL